MSSKQIILGIRDPSEFAGRDFIPTTQPGRNVSDDVGGSAFYARLHPLKSLHADTNIWIDFHDSIPSLEDERIHRRNAFTLRSPSIRNAQFQPNHDYQHSSHSSESGHGLMPAPESNFELLTECSPLSSVILTFM